MRMEFDVLSMCRLCLQGSENEMISIYDKEADESMFIYEKIEKCGDVKLSNDPELPPNICHRCNVFLSFAFKFQSMCQNSQNYLQEFGLKGVEDEDVEFEEAEYLVEYNPINEVEDSVREEYWEEIEQDENLVELDDNENGDEVVSSTKLSKRHLPQQQLQLKKKRSRPPAKTIGISSDGAAIIRVNNAKQLEKELKKNQSHICDVCGNVYPKKYALEAHMRRHRNERPFECEICQQRFTFNFQLTRHILKHTGARPYNCVYCQRSFTDRSTMKKHERLHRNERPYKCDTCNKTFTYSSVLKVHKLTHTGEKPFNCGICGKRFARAHHLRAHLETLLHSKDPQAKVLLKQIRRDEGIYEEDA